MSFPASAATGHAAGLEHADEGNGIKQEHQKYTT